VHKKPAEPGKDS